eukprot:1470570-Amphidinium_carterae.1
MLEHQMQAMELDALTAASRAMFQAALPTVFLKPPEDALLRVHRWGQPKIGTIGSLVLVKS